MRTYDKLIETILNRQEQAGRTCASWQMKRREVSNYMTEGLSPVFRIVLCAGI